MAIEAGMPGNRSGSCRQNLRGLFPFWILVAGIRPLTKIRCRFHRGRKLIKCFYLAGWSHRPPSHCHWSPSSRDQDWEGRLGLGLCQSASSYAFLFRGLKFRWFVVIFVSGGLRYWFFRFNEMPGGFAYKALISNHMQWRLRLIFMKLNFNPDSNWQQSNQSKIYIKKIQISLKGFWGFGVLGFWGF